MSYASHWEQHYAEHLLNLKRSGKLDYFRYEPVTFLIGDQCTYTPDFMVVHSDRSRPIEFHEVKGFQREDAIVKFKVAAANNPHFTFVMIGKNKDGSWKEMRRLVAGVKAPATRKSAPKQPSILTPKVEKNAPLMTVPKPNMTYAQMQSSPEIKRILDMKPEQLRNLRGDRSVFDMAKQVGMTERQWLGIETGRTRLYHYRHVACIKAMVEGKV